MKGICFIEPLFKSVVEGKKTQTRRIITVQPLDNRNWKICTLTDSTAKQDRKNIDKNHYVLTDEGNAKDIDNRYFIPRYRVGEILYLKEPYSSTWNEELKVWEKIYKFNGGLWVDDDGLLKWNNKLFMPASAARYFIRITAVRAERLQDITEEDCIREGIQEIGTFPYKGLTYYGIKGEQHFYKKEFTNPIDAYAYLIDSINGKGTWESNPFVYVYDFELTDKPKDEL